MKIKHGSFVIDFTGTKNCAWETRLQVEEREKSQGEWRRRRTDLIIHTISEVLCFETKSRRRSINHLIASSHLIQIKSRIELQSVLCGCDGQCSRRSRMNQCAKRSISLTIDDEHHIEPVRCIADRSHPTKIVRCSFHFNDFSSWNVFRIEWRKTLPMNLKKMIEDRFVHLTKRQSPFDFRQWKSIEHRHWGWNNCDSLDWSVWLCFLLHRDNPGSIDDRVLSDMSQKPRDLQDSHLHLEESKCFSVNFQWIDHHRDWNIESERFVDLRSNWSIDVDGKRRVNDVCLDHFSPTDTIVHPVRIEHFLFDSSLDQQYNRRNVDRWHSLIKEKIHSDRSASIFVTFQCVIAECRFCKSILSISLTDRLNRGSVVNQWHLKTIGIAQGESERRRRNSVVKEKNKDQRTFWFLHRSSDNRRDFLQPWSEPSARARRRCNRWMWISDL